MHGFYFFFSIISRCVEDDLALGIILKRYHIIGYGVYLRSTAYYYVYMHF